MTDLSTPRVLAAVMTYNRRESLRTCLRAIAAQTVFPAHVLVIDNASTDGTAGMLPEAFPWVEVHRTPENLGCAGAMHEALRLALEAAPDYIWLLDEDVAPFPACLETLLREIRPLEQEVRIGALRPMVRDPRTGNVGGGGTSHASLLSAAMARDVGLPPSETFIELSDHIYNAMVRKHGYEILRVPFVLAEHPVRRVEWLRSIAREGFRAAPWRLYYAVRNRVWHSLYAERSIQRFLLNVVMALRTLLLLTMFGRPRRGHTMIFRGMMDGMRGRLGRRVEPDY